MKSLAGVLCCLCLFTLMNVANAGEKLGILWEGKSTLVSQFVEEFTKALKEKMPDIEIEVLGATPSAGLAEKKYEEWLGTKDAIFFPRTSGLNIMAKNPPKIPGFCGVCSNPVLSNATTTLEKPDKNITGVTYYIPAAVCLDLYKKFVPNAKTVCLVVDETNPSAKPNIEETEAWAKKNGMTFKLVQGKNKGDWVAGAKAVNDEVDFFVLGYQTTVSTASPLLVKVCSKPIFTYHPEAITKKGAVCGYFSDNMVQAHLLADSVTEVLKDKKPVSAVPVKMDPKPELKICDEVLKKYNLTVPADLKK